MPEETNLHVCTERNKHGRGRASLRSRRFSSESSKRPVAIMKPEKPLSILKNTDNTREQRRCENTSDIVTRQDCGPGDHAKNSSLDFQKALA